MGAVLVTLSRSLALYRCYSTLDLLQYVMWMAWPLGLLFVVLPFWVDWPLGHLLIFGEIVAIPAVTVIVHLVTACKLHMSRGATSNAILTRTWKRMRVYSLVWIVFCLPALTAIGLPCLISWRQLASNNASEYIIELGNILASLT